MFCLQRVHHKIHKQIAPKALETLLTVDLPKLVQMIPEESMDEVWNAICRTTL